MARKRRLLVPEAREAINKLMKDVLQQRETESNQNQKQNQALPQQHSSPGHSLSPTFTQVPAQASPLSGPSTGAVKPVTPPAPAGAMVEKLIRLAKLEQQKNDPSMRK